MLVNDTQSISPLLQKMVLKEQVKPLQLNSADEPTFESAFNGSCGQLSPISSPREGGPKTMRTSRSPVQRNYSKLLSEKLQQEDDVWSLDTSASSRDSSDSGESLMDSTDTKRISGLIPRARLPSFSLESKNDSLSAPTVGNLLAADAEASNTKERQDIKKLVSMMRNKEEGLSIKTRYYHLRSYPKCFVGVEAVDWLVQKLNVGREEAAAIGELLLQMGIIAHVCRSEHFADKYFFYRFVEDEDKKIEAEIQPFNIRIGHLNICNYFLSELSMQLSRPGTGVEIKDRKYLLTTYRSCFIGTEAVTWIVKALNVSREDAEKIGQLLVDHTIIEQ